MKMALTSSVPILYFLALTTQLHMPLHSFSKLGKLHAMLWNSVVWKYKADGSSEYLSLT